MSLPGTILITGTDTGVGKTITTAALAAVLEQRGGSVAVYKPCQSGNAAGDSDCTEIQRLAAPAKAEAGIVLEQPLAPVPAAALDGVTLPPLEHHAARIRELGRTHSHVLVEGAGGLLVELDHDGGTLAGLGSLLGGDAAFVVVARPSLGTLNHTALTLEALQNRGLAVLGVVFGSWPAEPGVVELSNRETIGQWPVALLGAIPYLDAVPFLGGPSGDAEGWETGTFRTQAATWLELPA
ncbi:dethiobiotin synthase [Paenarthrobacter ureafaciens]|uniref:dethiobiotin synthase n=1 Tax=Paenarthrobacter ureafaciens TaxID=37931 RepID=UPI001916DE70|nr:dethiobiotin synthase [Paenarthrobacter ureafaciens]QQQ63175.1 dethiobiotin synthase [Paenarthrobacter ureafaciens]